MRPLQTDGSAVAVAVKKWLDDRGLRAVTLARRCDVRPETLSRVLHGREPSLRLALAIERETGIEAKRWLE
jgi:predicted transcriptional regulator